jgi:hypothetical protein
MATTKLIQPAPNTALYPVDGNFGNMLAWREGNAGALALNDNQITAQNWLNNFNLNWLVNYMDGKMAWDAQPPSPPVGKWAQVTETQWPNGAWNVDVELVADPTGTLVCQVPFFHRLPPPQGGTVSLMGQLVAEGAAAAGTPTIVTVAVGKQSTDSAGNIWFRMQSEGIS